MVDLITITQSQLDVVRRTVAKDLNSTEFDLFIALAKRTGLDPFRRQIIPIVFNANKPDKRKMETILTRDGYRCIASRCGNYRPKSGPATFVYDDGLKDDLNPAGIVSCSVVLHWQDKQHVWHEVVGEAYWEEYAPIEDEWAWCDQSSKRKPTGKKKLSGNWQKMPRVMLEKCAESSALRAGWPEEFAGLYSEEEMDKAFTDDRTASEALNQEIAERRERAVNFKGKVPVNFGEGIEYIEVGKYADKWLEKKRQVSPQIFLTLRDQNRECLKEFWTKDADAALELKEEFEKAEQEIKESEAA